MYQIQEKVPDYRFTLHYSILPVTKETLMLYLSCTVTPVIIKSYLALAVYATGMLKQGSTISSKIHAHSESSPSYKVIL